MFKKRKEIENVLLGNYNNNNNKLSDFLNA